MAKEFDLKNWNKWQKNKKRDILAMLTEAGSGHPSPFFNRNNDSPLFLR